MMRGTRHRDNTRGGRSSTGLRPLAWVSPTPLGVLRGQLPGAKGNPRARKHEIVRLILIGEEITKCSVSDGHGLNGRSSTRGGRCKTPTRSPSSSEPGRRPQPRGWRANETHRTTGGRRHGQQDRESLNGPTQRLTCVSPTSRRCVPWESMLASRRCISDPRVCPSHRGVGSFAGQWRA
jgi:hypothetical protein